MICDMCGEQEAKVKIDNPNDFDDEDKPVWDVCNECKEFIQAGQQLAFGMAVQHATGDDTVLHEAEMRLNRLQQVSGQPMLIAKVKVKKNGQ